MGVLSRIMRSKALARTAVAMLTVGLFALAGLALASIAGTAKTTSAVRGIDSISDEWGQVSVHLSVEYEALTDYLRADSDVGRQPLVSAIGSAEENLRWLEEHGGRTEARNVASLRATYAAYTDTLRRLVAAENRGDQRQVALHAEQAALSASSLRKQSVANSSRKRLELNAYLVQVERDNARLRLIAVIVAGADLLLLTLCTTVLLTYQRRTERQAIDSRHQSLHDVLTGIPNRLLLNDRISDALRSADANGTTVGLLLLDLDRFKEVNDTLGHYHGDLLLQQVAARLTGAIRHSDTVARLGGDEFAVLLPNVLSAPDAMNMANRLLECLSRPADLDGMVVDVRASVGAAIYPHPSGTAIELLQHADIAMYTAKRGHLGAALYDPADDDHSSDQLVLLGELRAAIELGELVLHYQPKVAAAGGDVVGVEALVRWQHPRRGLLGPGEFIPLAEQTELIQPLTEYVLRAALAQHGEWRRAGIKLPVAVNIATRCLLDTGFPAQIAGLLAEFSTEPAQLTLEITESTVISDPDRAIDLLRQLRDGGVRLSIDDFGTGYSSMAYLQTLPVHELKIDRSFVAEMDTTRSSAAIVLAIVELGHALDLEVVAEGVEDDIALTGLVALGCDIAQGYHICRPIPAAGIADWLAARQARVAEPVSS